MKRKYPNPFATLTKTEWLLWGGSLAAIALTLLLSGGCDLMVLFALLVGATALIFVSKGDPLGQLLTIVFAVIYGVISFRFRYWGEMITYVGMTAPMAVAALISWLRHPFEEGKAEVEIMQISKKTWAAVLLLTAAVTAVFYRILRFLDTAQLFWSTVSIATSFSACALTYLRSPYYAAAYSANDVVLMILWYLAARNDAGYYPMILCFAIFLCNDVYGFWNWRRMRQRQQQTERV